MKNLGKKKVDKTGRATVAQPRGPERQRILRSRALRGTLNQTLHRRPTQKPSAVHGASIVSGGGGLGTQELSSPSSLGNSELGLV